MAGKLVFENQDVVVEEIRHPATAFGFFKKLKGRQACVFLDSALPSEKLGRYSIVACEPFLTLSGKGNEIEAIADNRRTVYRVNPFEVIRAFLLGCHIFPQDLPEGIPPFFGGAIGYLGYDLNRTIERLPTLAVDDLGLPDFWLGFYDTAVVVDELEGRAFLVAAVPPFLKKDGVTAWHRLYGLKRMLKTKVKDGNGGAQAASGSLRPNFTQEGYLNAVRQAKDYIKAGDIFQVNLSQRFSAPLQTAPLELYRRLRHINPAPFAAYLQLPEMAVASSSPERFLRFSGDYVETRPIKGTRPRGADPASDAALRAELLSSAKDRAELVMIIDLERNDLGRFCSPGTVRVPELVVCEEHPTVFHLVSTVTGRVAPGRDRIECIRSCFPGGSITGAPKVRAMEIVEELEPVKRGIYTGAIGYLGFDGEVDLNIAIRTFILKDGTAYFQVGGGIVADSDPAAEYQETLDKARALFAALNAGGERG